MRHTEITQMEKRQMRHIDKIKREGIHAANLADSEGLQSIMKVLECGGWYSAREIREASNGAVEAVSARIQELTSPINNIQIECKYLDGQYRYRLMGKGESDGTGKRRTETSEARLKEYASDSPAPPKKWDDWGCLEKEEEQGRMF